jgi:hypothetical protein
MTPQILIKIDNVDGPESELVIIKELIGNELDRCASCNKIHTETELIPYHCNSCRIIRDERWLQSLHRRARQFVSAGAFMTRH